MEIRIQNLMEDLAISSREFALLEKDISDFRRTKSNISQSALNICECQAVLRAMYNCLLECSSIKGEVVKHCGSLERVKCELQHATEESFMTQSDCSTIKNQVSILEENTLSACKNTSALQMNVSNLRAKLGTNRARASGAENDRVTTLQNLNKVRFNVADRFRAAESDLEYVVNQGRASFDRMQLLRKEIKSEIAALDEFITRQMMILIQCKRVKLTAA